MSETYMKGGRGGAGNFYSKQDLIDAAKAANLNDPEAQPLPTDPNSINDLTRTNNTTTSTPAPEYLHTGRGGAGNWVQPTVLQSQGLSQSASPNPTSTASIADPNPNPTYNKAIFGAPRRAIGTSKPMYRGGRGGAGNYMDVEAEEKVRKEADQAREEAEERAKADVERRVEKDVEAGLARPPRAYGGAGGAWEMVDMK